MKTILVLMIIIYINKALIEVDAEINVADFSEIIKSKNYVDKTMLIKDFLTGEETDKPYIIEMTAPPRFGKSTVIDMVKRFIQVNVDNTGRVLEPNTTANYKLFCDPPLNICKDKTFVREHLGRHPVIHIDYKRLFGVIDYESLLFEARELLSETYIDHSYLEKAEDLWPHLEEIKREEFNTYIYSGSKLKRQEVSRGFYLLSYILYKHFKKKVIVLIDDFDAYARKILFRKVKDLNKIMDFCMGMNARLLKSNNNFVSKGLVTGVLRIDGQATIARDCIFRGNHEFSKYFGYTSEEIDGVLARKVSDEKDRDEKKREIESFYGGFTILGQSEVLCNFWSISQYLRGNMKPNPYWARSKYIQPLRSLICVPKISEVVLDLVKGETYDLYIKERFRKEDILELAKVIYNKEKHVHEIFWSFLLLYTLGYLTVHETGSTIHSSLDTLKIPNTDLLIDLTKQLKHCYLEEFGYSEYDVEELVKAVDGFQPHKVGKEAFHNFYKSLFNVFNNTISLPDANSDVRNIIFVNLLEKFYQSKCNVRTTYSYNETVTENGKIDMLVINSHGVAIVFETKIVTTSQMKNTTLDKLAIVSHQLIVRQNQQYVLENLGYATGRVYVGMAFHKETGNFSLACSSFTHSDGDYRNTTVIGD